MNSLKLTSLAAACVFLLACEKGPVSGDAELKESPANIVGKNIEPEYSTSPMDSMVFVHGEKHTGGAGLCGGLAIGRRHILTAKHCIHGDNPVKVGLPQRDQPHQSKSTLFSNSKFIEVEDFTQTYTAIGYPEFNPLAESLAPLTDMVILKLKEDLPASVPVFNITEMATDKDIRSGELIAFGYNTSKMKTSGLFSATFKNIFRAKTKFVLASEAMINEQNKKSPLDLGRPLYGSSADDLKIVVYSATNYICRGDSGSSLFVKVGNTYKLLGVASEAVVDSTNTEISGILCSHGAVYQTVRPLQKWIIDSLIDGY